jgi:hypothetical protein
VIAPDTPRLDERRTKDFAAELQARARAWIPSWGLADAEGDFGRALLEIAARFSSEVAERLDGAGDKMRRGFLDWLAVRGLAARPARVPVVFKLADAARVAVLAEAPARMQVDAGGTPVVFETEKDVRVVPGRLASIVGVDADQDAFYLAPPGLSDLQPLEAAPTRWQAKSFAAAGATKFQLDPEGGLAEGSIIEADGQQYRVKGVDKDLVTIEPPLAGGLSPATIVSKVETFTPFEGTARNWQEHALYFGDADLLNVEAAATIEVIGATTLRSGVTWQYYGKVDGDDEVGWQTLALGSEDEQRTAKGIILKKKKGAVETTDIAGRSSRWIRAFNRKSDALVRSDEFTIGINAELCADEVLRQAPDPDLQSAAAEGMANTTPLVLENVFLPLGREPRQFDAFYLGSKEVFSKPHASVRLWFEMADPKFAALASLRQGSSGDQVLAGVAADGHLHLLQFSIGTAGLSRYAGRDPLRPPSPGNTGAAVAGTSVPLDPRPAYRPPMWVGIPGINFFVAVAAGNSVWLWHENQFLPSASGWIRLGPVIANADSTTRLTGLVHLADAGSGQLFALVNTTLYVRDLNAANGAWQSVVTRDGAADVDLVQIAPIAVEVENLNGNINQGLVGVDSTGRLYAIELSGAPLAGACTQLLDTIEQTMVPAAVRRSDDRLVAVAMSDDPTDRTLFGFLSTPGTLILEETDEATLDWPDAGGDPDIAGTSIDLNAYSNGLTFVVSIKSSEVLTAVAAWTPEFSPTEFTPVFITSIPSTIGNAGGAPTLLPQHLLVPTMTGEVIVAPFDPLLRSPRIAPLETVVITDAPEDRLVVGDIVAFLVDDSGSDVFQEETIPDSGISHGGEVFHAFATPTVGDALLVYKLASPIYTGTLPDPAILDEMRLDGADATTRQDSVLRIATHLSIQLYNVDTLVGDVATLDRALDITDDTQPIDYQSPDRSDARVRSSLRLDPAASGNWDANLLTSTRLRFPDGEPEFQVGTALEVDGSHPVLVALRDTWTTIPIDPIGTGVRFTIDASVGGWTRQLGDSSSNPDLSWEYWNGTGWWTLGAIHDDTLNLKRTGAVRFTVPADLKESDWSGKTNHWIRARLIGGDYGQEKVTVVSVTVGNTTTQTVQRSLDGIRAPSVLKLHLSYGLCDGALPSFVLAADSGSIRDQSDANKTPGAVVEGFVPLSVLLGRLSDGATTSEPTASDCPPECGCGGTHNAGATASTAGASSSSSAVTPAGGRALLIGVNAPLSEAPVNVLLLVDEHNYASLAPLTTEALIADRFQPIVADDATRALGESGVLSMAFAVQPAPRELFGQTLTWLRLRAKPSATLTWAPTLRGAYLNAVWASATETLTRELLGSSQGEPNLTLRVARPPVLHDTLELRVREPLGDEEREELQKEGPLRVLSRVDGLDGDWVLWDRVIDPGDEAPSRRVYALDESNGEVRFGDGLHGRIPPIGRDSIVAFSYKRTEAGPPGSDKVPANTITARTPLNLVSPVESVEAVIAADQAAGGTPPESVDRVMRFGFARLRHRSRAVTIRDIEDLTLQSSPDIAQARAFAGRGYVRVVVVMKGRNPQPTAAQVRELRRLLLDAAPSTLAAPSALRISGPSVRQLRVHLQLRTETLDYAGDLLRDVKARLASFFDTATGGAERLGWPLGVNPSEEDVALALIDIPHLDSIEDVGLREIVGDEEEQPWPSSLKRHEIALLADDSVRIQFETAEMLA